MMNDPLSSRICADGSAHGHPDRLSVGSDVLAMLRAEGMTGIGAATFLGTPMVWRLDVPANEYWFERRCEMCALDLKVSSDPMANDTTYVVQTVNGGRQRYVCAECHGSHYSVYHKGVVE